jgi:hypothetical protein
MFHSNGMSVNLRRGQVIADIGCNALKAIKKGQSRWGSPSAPIGTPPDADFFTRHKQLPALFKGLSSAPIHSLAGRVSARQRFQFTPLFRRQLNRGCLALCHADLLQ